MRLHLSSHFCQSRVFLPLFQRGRRGRSSGIYRRGASLFARPPEEASASLCRFVRARIPFQYPFSIPPSVAHSPFSQPLPPGSGRSFDSVLIEANLSPNDHVSWAFQDQSLSLLRMSGPAGYVVPWQRRQAARPCASWLVFVGAPCNQPIHFSRRIVFGLGGNRDLKQQLQCLGRFWALCKIAHKLRGDGR